jgi:integrase
MYALNLTAAATGLRLGELQALQGRDIRDDHIIVERSLCRKYGLKPTKTGNTRIVPIPSMVAAALAPLRQGDPEEFVFARGAIPVGHEAVGGAYKRALARVRISIAEQRNQGLTFHSWRHFANSILRSRVPDSVLRKITGHATEEMTERYSHQLPADLLVVREAQENLFALKEAV